MSERGFGWTQRLVYYDTVEWHAAVKDMARENDMSVSELLRRIVRDAVTASVQSGNAGGVEPG